ncbi:MAG: DUF2165 domain-containing protein [Nitrosomonas sp.]
MTLVFAIALFASLVVFNNVTDYDSNFTLVQHVFKMDTIFPDSKGFWRAIDSPGIHRSVYGFIIFTEFVIAVFCWVGGFRLSKHINNARSFDQSKNPAIIGLTLGMLLWFTGFMTIGGEWFLMWQSESANGQEAAFRLVVILGIVLIYLVQPDAEKQI